MNDAWTIDRLFDNEKGRNPFAKGPEEMLLWECHGNDEAVCVYRGYDVARLQYTMTQLQNDADNNTTFCVEFPQRKGEVGKKFVAKRSPVHGAHYLPNSEQKMLLSLIENRWGAALNEQDYMKSRGKIMNFYMRSDNTHETIFSFDNWDDIRTMAYTRP